MSNLKIEFIVFNFDVKVRFLFELTKDDAVQFIFQDFYISFHYFHFNIILIV